MARLPQPGGDAGSWGTILNTFLDVAHNSDGTLNPNAVSSAGAALTTNNLSDLQNPTIARANLGLGSAATRNVGTVSGTIAAADDSRITGAEQSANKGAASGYAPLDSTSKLPVANLPVTVPTANLGSGTANNTTFLRGDQMWASLPSAPVVSVFGRTGAVVAQNGDYTAAQIGALSSADDISAIATLNATTANVSMNSHKITNLANGAAASDAAAFGQIPTTASQVNAAQGITPTGVKISNYSAVSGDYIPVDISGGSVTITLPSGPADKTRIGVKVIKVPATPGTTTVNVVTSGSDVFNVSGGSTTVTLNAKFQGILLQYAASTAVWYIHTTDTPLNEALGAALVGSDGTIGGPGGTQLTNAAVSRDWDYLIINNSGTAQAINGSTGSVDFSSSSDHASIFQNCVNALNAASGGKIAFKGQFTFNSQLVIYPGIALVGQGPLSDKPGYPVTTPVRGATISSITFNGSLIVATGTTTGGGSTTYKSFPYLANFNLVGKQSGLASQNGIEVNDTTGGQLLDLYVDNVIIMAMGQHGLFHNSAAKVWVNGCYFENNTVDGINVSGNGTLRVMASYIFGNTGRGINVQSGSTTLVYYCPVWNNTLQGVWISTSNEVQLIGNSFTDNGGPSYVSCSVDNSSRAVVVGNTFRDDRGSGQVVRHLWIAGGNSTRGLVVGNILFGQTGDAIRVSAYVNNHLVIADNQGYNDTKGTMSTPFTSTGNRMGPEGSTASPSASTAYQVSSVRQYVVVSGGTGVSITISDPAGNTLQSGLATYSGLLPLGYTINFGAFSVAPTVLTSVA